MVDIAIWNPIVFNDVKRLLECKYSGDASFNDTIIVVGYNVANISPAAFRNSHPGKKIIVYNLEQFYPGSRWFNERAIDWFRMADEIWDYDLCNIDFLRYHGYGDIKYHPMEFCDKLAIDMRAERDIDVLFYGAPTNRRLSAMQKFMGTLQYKYACIFGTGISGHMLEEFLARTKILVNIHADERMTRQEQVRMFIPVSSGMCVVSETSPVNEFGKSIVECDLANFTPTLEMLLRTDEWKRVADNARDVYRQHCENRKYR